MKVGDIVYLKPNWKKILMKENLSSITYDEQHSALEQLENKYLKICREDKLYDEKYYVAKYKEIVYYVSEKYFDILKIDNTLSNYTYYDFLIDANTKGIIGG